MDLVLQEKDGYEEILEAASMPENDFNLVWSSVRAKHWAAVRDVLVRLDFDVKENEKVADAFICDSPDGRRLWVKLEKR